MAVNGDTLKWALEKGGYLGRGSANGSGGTAVDASRAIELAYGLLWQLAVDTRTPRGVTIVQVRRALLAMLDPAGQARGIEAASRLAIAESRKNPR